MKTEESAAEEKQTFDDDGDPDLLYKISSARQSLCVAGW